MPLASEIIDVFCHWLPPRFCAYADRHVAQIPFMWNRARAMPVMTQVEARLHLMAEFPGYRQIPSIASPPLEFLAGPQETPGLAQAANAAAAEIVQAFPQAFPGFVAALPLNNPEASVREAERAVNDMGACGVQVFTNIQGKPLDCPEYLSLLDALAEKQIPVWLHPSRGMNTPDYRDETWSKYDLWWVFGWPYETSLAMTRLVFTGIFDRYPDFKVITHHGGGIVPMLEGRLSFGLDQLGTRNPPELVAEVRTSLKERPVEALRHFYADTATFGNRAGIECALSFFGVDHLLFASDMPFDPEHGPGYIRETLKDLAEMKLSDADRVKILAGNAKRILCIQQKIEDCSDHLVTMGFQ